jgi:sulfur-oxidizing protein SoxX
LVTADWRVALAGAALMLASATMAQPAVTGDRIDPPLTATRGDAESGLRIFATRDGGHCVLCHAAPGFTTAGNVGPALSGVGTRLSPAQLRLRIVDITRVKPDAAMPAFHRTTHLNRVASDRASKTILTAQQVEDLVAWLSTLK